MVFDEGLRRRTFRLNEIVFAIGDFFRGMVAYLQREFVNRLVGLSNDHVVDIGESQVLLFLFHSYCI